MTTHQPFVLAAGPALSGTTERVPATVLSRAERHPDRPAVICGDRTLGYRDLAGAARATAAAVDAHPAGPASRRIGVQAARSERTVAQILGTWLSGRSAVLVDPLVQERTLARIRSSAGLLLTTDPATDTLLHHPLPAGTPLPDPTPSQEAYVLHPSGPTGHPRGVSVSHPNLTASNSARLAVYREFGVPVLLLLPSFHTDASVAGTWGTLTAGGTLVVAGEEEHRNPGALLGLIARHGVTHLLAEPGFHAELLASWARHPDAAELLATLRVLISTGGTLPQSLIEQHFALLPDVALAGEYGPTECTVWSTHRIHRRPARSTAGFPIPGTQLHLLDDRLRPVGPGQTGRIAVSGPGVACGYVGDRRRTAEVFVDLAAPCGRVSRAHLTGDLGRWSDEEGLEVLGRVDDEVRLTVEAVEEAFAGNPAARAALDRRAGAGLLSRV
ncbi:AMP-binding protein [Kitasatospora sp. NPDC051853]|uniref:AMP-binding protein n=1 Tax=Kitasatospora sp. NPDC051853 TaxID=3364058 RepID=UPI0037A8BE18